MRGADLSNCTGSSTENQPKNEVIGSSHTSHSLPAPPLLGPPCWDHVASGTLQWPLRLQVQDLVPSLWVDAVTHCEQLICSKPFPSKDPLTTTHLDGIWIIAREIPKGRDLVARVPNLLPSQPADTSVCAPGSERVGVGLVEAVGSGDTGHRPWPCRTCARQERARRAGTEGMLLAAAPWACGGLLGSST